MEDKTNIKSELSWHLDGLRARTLDIAALMAEISTLLRKDGEDRAEVAKIEALITKKRNQMLATGGVLGKNAEERAASLWVAIPEYDDLVIAEARARDSAVNLNIAMNNLDSLNKQANFHRQALSVISRLEAVTEAEVK